MDITMNGGNGGRGGDGAHIGEGSYDSTIGGHGGNVLNELTIGPVYGGNIKVYSKTGNGGDGGVATRTESGIILGKGGWGGSTEARVRIEPSYSSDPYFGIYSDITVETGKGGDNAPLNLSWFWGPEETLDSIAYITQYGIINTTISAVAGDVGNGGKRASDEPLEPDGKSVSYVSCDIGFKGIADITAKSLVGKSPGGYVNVPSSQYKPKMSGTTETLTWDYSGYNLVNSETYFVKDDDITIVETNPIADQWGEPWGNPLRVDGLNGAHGWFSGNVNGDGVPLLGYENPKGTGTKYGRYWE